jgi:hypothetical protein
MANKPNNPALWSRAKSMAKQKFDVYPSAYANGWAAKWYKSKGGTWRKAEYGMEVMGNGGTPDNPGFNALPPAVQQKIMDNMAQGGEKMPPEIARARFAAAGNLDKMGDYGYAYGGYIPEMMFGGYDRMQQGGQQDQITMIVEQFAQMNQVDPNQIMQELQQLPVEQQEAAIQKMAEAVQQGGQQPDMMQAAMAYGGYTTGVFADGGEPNGGMALGQMSAVADKMSKLRQFVSPEQNLDPWIASKLAIMDDSADAISDYMMYNPEAQEDEVEDEYEQEDIEEMMANGGYVVTRSNDRKGKTHKVTGPDGTVKYFGDSKLGQHPKDPERKKAFYARHKKNLENNPFFRAFARKTWKEGGSTFSGNAWYQEGGSSVTPLVPYNKEYMDALGKEYKNFYSNKPPFLPVPKNDDGFDAFYHSKYDPLPNTRRIASGWITTLKNPIEGFGDDFTEDNGETMAPKARKNTIVKRVENHEVVERPSSDYSRITKHLQDRLYKPGMNFLNFYQDGGEPQLENYPDYGSWRADMYRYNAGQMGDQAPQAVMQEEPKMMWHPEWEEQGIDPEAQNSARTITPASASTANIAPTAVAPTIDYSGVSIVDLLRSTGKASDYNSRKQLAEQLGIDGYYGSAKQNLDLIKKITSNPAVLNDYKPVASSSRSGTSSSRSRSSSASSNASNTAPATSQPVVTQTGPAPATNALPELFAQAKNAYLAANPGMTSADYDAMMAANRPKQTTIGPATRPLPASSGSDPYDDSYMLNKIANDPETPGNVRSRKQKEFARNMGLTALAAIPFLSWTRYYPLLRGLPEFASTMARGARALPGGAKALPSGVRALPQAGKALPKPGPTNWVTNSGMAFNMGGSFPMEEYKQGGINLDPAKKGTFKAQATRMGMGVQEAASAILNAPEGKYSPAMRKKANFAKNFAKQMGGPVAGEIMDVTPEQLEALRQQGYEFEIM